MRVPTCVSAAKHKARAPQNEALVPFKELLPLRLRNHVSGKADSNKEVACLQEMAVLFACLKTNDFAEKLCAKEISQFKNCYKVYLERNAVTKETINQGDFQIVNEIVGMTALL